MAGFISEETIEAVSNNTDIVSVIGEYTKLENRGANDYWGCCPFHGEKTPSFHVDAGQKFYYCFGCHASGNIIKFVMEMEKLSYPDAITTLAKKQGIPVKYKDGYEGDKNFQKDNSSELYIELYERTASMFHYLLTETQMGKAALDYITKRGLTADTIKKFKLGFAPADPKWLKNFLRQKNFSDDFLNKSGLFSQKYPDYSFFTNRLMFPIFNRKGQIVAFGGRVIPPADESQRKYLNSGDLPQFKKRETLFGFNFAKNSIRQNKKIIFCEGNMDVIAYHQCGLDYAVATLGTALTQEHIKMILDRPKKISTTRNDFGQFYGFLQKSASSYSRAIPKTDDRIELTRNQLDEIKEHLEELEAKHEEILVELNNAGGNEDNSETNDKIITSDYGVVIETISSKERAISNKEKDIILWEKSLEQINKRLNSYKKNTATQKYEDFALLMREINDIINQTKDDIFDKTISALAKEANEKYMALTSGNQSSGGVLKFERNHDIVNVSIRDVQNGVITGLGTGFQRMKQLAIVMAVISSKIGDEKKFDYPFISDAPFSEFGENFISNFFRVAPSVFTQSIIMIKELYDPKANDYLTAFGRRILEDMKSGKLPGTFYVNVIKDKTDTTGLVTSHKCYKY